MTGCMTSKNSKFPGTEGKIQGHASARTHGETSAKHEKQVSQLPPKIPHYTTTVQQHMNG